MAAPLGNKNAVGNKGGRPRTNCPEHDELVELAKDLVEWASQPDSMRFCEWYTSKGFIESQWDSFRQKVEFYPYYENARALLGRKYMDGTVNPSIAHRFLRIYTPEVKRDEEDKARFEAEIAAKANQDAISEQAAAQMATLLEQLSQYQAAFNASRSNKSSDK